MIGWEIVISALLTLVIFLLGLILKRQEAMSAKLDTKQGKEDCERQVARCAQTHGDIKDNQCHEAKDIWDAFGRHSHTGLPADSKVTR